MGKRKTAPTCRTSVRGYDSRLLRSRGLTLHCVALGHVRVGDWSLESVGYGIYPYFTWVGAGQGRVTAAFLGAVLIKGVIRVLQGKNTSKPA